MDSEIIAIDIEATCGDDYSFGPSDLPFLEASPKGFDAGKKSRPKQKSYRKKVESAWSHERIIKLIEEVEVRRSLWDAGCPNYKLPKDLLWQEVADLIPASFNDTKGKWTNLRTTFNYNLEKLRRKKSGQSTDEEFQIVWRYFKPMLFLETTKVRQTTQSISSLQLETANSDMSLLNDLGFVEDLQPTSPRTSTKQRNTLKSTQSVRSASLKEVAIEALQSLGSSQTKDSCTLFGEYIAAELKTLSAELAAIARAKLRRAFNDIMDEVALMVTQQPQQ